MIVLTIATFPHLHIIDLDNGIVIYLYFDIGLGS